MRTLQNLIGFLGRLCLSIIFIVSGLYKVFHWDETKESLVTAIDAHFTSQTLPVFIQEIFRLILDQLPVFLGIAAGCELMGSALLLLGIGVRFGAFLLLAFLVPTTFVFHHFWLLEGADQNIQMIMFLKNLAIVGGLLLLLAFGVGSKSQDSAPKSKA